MAKRERPNIAALLDGEATARVGEVTAPPASPETSNPGTPEAGGPGTQQRVGTASPEQSKTERQKASNKGIQQTVTPDEPPTTGLIKVTVYLDPQTAARIDDALFDLKRRHRPAKVLKSDLVETLLRFGLDELDAKGDRSEVARRVPRKARGDG